MTRGLALVGAVALVLTTSVASPASAQASEFPITATPAETRPAETTTVTGDATDPTCENDGVVVTLHYTRPDGSTGTTSVNTTADSAGHFTATLTVPADAVAGADAHIGAVINDCTPTGGPTSSRTSEAEPFEVLAYEGTFIPSTATGEPGDTVTFTGTNCWGGDIVVFFGPDTDIDVTLNPDKTFSGSYVLPDAPEGTYEFGAECPGTDFESVAFLLVNPDAAAPPAPPVTAPPTFTG